MENKNLYNSTTLSSVHDYNYNFHLTTNKSNNLNRNNNIKDYKDFPKISTINKSSTYLNLKIPKIKTTRIFHRNISFKLEEQKNQKKEISSSIFQSNDVEFVRNLNPDSNKNLCSNLLLKEQLKNEINSKIKLSSFFNINKKQKGYKRQSLPKLKFLSINNISENENKINDSKNDFSKNKQSNLLEKELTNILKEINEKYFLKKENKKKIYEKYENLLKEIDNATADMKLFEQKKNTNSSIKIRESKIGDLNKKTISKASLRGISYESINSKYNKQLGENEVILENENKEMNEKNSSNDNKNVMNINKNKNSSDRKLSMIKIMYEEKKRKELERKSRNDKIMGLKNQLNQMKKQLNSINIEINDLKNNEKNIKQKLMNFYQELLFNGTEIRNEGLIWIIKAIWKLGENVPTSFMPTFLDFNGIKYLFSMAILSVELESKKNNVFKLKDKLRTQLINLSQKKENKIRNKSNFNYEHDKNHNHNKKYNFIFKTNLLTKNSKLSRSSSQRFMKTFFQSNKHFNMNINNKILNHNDEDDDFLNLTVRDVSKILEENDNGFDITKLPALDEINNLEKEIKEMENNISDNKKNEINRIFKEFIDNDYQNKYQTTIDVVLGSLFGESMRNKQVNKFNAFKKEYMDEMRNIRFYEYSKKK